MANNRQFVFHLFIYNLSAIHWENYARCVRMKAIETTIMEQTYGNTHNKKKREAKRDWEQTHWTHKIRTRNEHWTEWIKTPEEWQRDEFGSRLFVIWFKEGNTKIPLKCRSINYAFVVEMTVMQQKNSICILMQTICGICKTLHGIAALK